MIYGGRSFCELSVSDCVTSSNQDNYSGASLKNGVEDFSLIDGSGQRFHIFLFKGLGLRIWGFSGLGGQNGYFPGFGLLSGKTVKLLEEIGYGLSGRRLGTVCFGFVFLRGSSADDTKINRIFRSCKCPPKKKSTFFSPTGNFSSITGQK